MSIGGNAGEILTKNPIQVESAENEDTQVSTKKVLVYGYDPDGMNKVRLKVDSAGALAVAGANSISVANGTATSSGSTVIKAGETGKKIRVYNVFAQNQSTDPIFVYFAGKIAGVSPQSILPSTLAQYQPVMLNIGSMNKYLELDTGEALSIVLGAGGSVNWNILFSVV